MDSLEHQISYLFFWGGPCCSSFLGFLLCLCFVCIYYVSCAQYCLYLLSSPMVLNIGVRVVHFVLLCVFTFLVPEFTPGFCWGSVLLIFLVFCVVFFVLFVFVLCRVHMHPMLPFFLDCPFLIAPSAFFNV